MAKHLSPAERAEFVAEIKRLKADGMSQAAAARELGISEQTVGKWIKDEKSKRTRTRTVNTQPDALQVAKARIVELERENQLLKDLVVEQLLQQRAAKTTK